MSIVFVSASAANNTAASSTSLGITSPSGIVSGNYLVANFVSPQGITITNPTGFTTLLTQTASTGVQMRVCTKVADGTEGATLTFSVSGSNTTLAGSVMQFSGVTTVSSIRASGSSGAAAATSKTSDSLAGTQATDMVVIFGGARPEASSATNTVTGPSTGGWTSPAAAKSGAGNGTFPSSTAIGYQINGTTGAFTTNVSSGIASAALSLIAGVIPPKVIITTQSI